MYEPKFHDFYCINTYNFLSEQTQREWLDSFAVPISRSDVEEYFRNFSEANNNTGNIIALLRDGSQGPFLILDVSFKRVWDFLSEYKHPYTIWFFLVEYKNIAPLIDFGVTF